MTGHEEDQVITVRCPPQRLKWLAAELRAAGLPFEAQRAGNDYHVQTTAAAAPQLHKVLDPKPRRPWWHSGRFWGVVVLLGVVGMGVYLFMFAQNPQLDLLLRWGVSADDTITRAALFVLASLAVSVVGALLVGRSPAGWGYTFKENLSWGLFLAAIGVFLMFYFE